jgi:hypothetical protein
MSFSLKIAFKNRTYPFPPQKSHSSYSVVAKIPTVNCPIDFAIFYCRRGKDIRKFCQPGCEKRFEISQENPKIYGCFTKRSCENYWGRQQVVGAKV